MSKITIRYTATQGLRERVLASRGEILEEKTTLDLATLEPALRERFVQVMGLPGNLANYNEPAELGYRIYSRAATLDVEPTPETLGGILDAVAARKQAETVAAQKEKDEKWAEIVARVRSLAPAGEDALLRYGQPVDVVPGSFREHRDRADYAEISGLAREIERRQGQIVVEYKARVEAQDAARQEAARLEREAKAADRRAWIEANGSDFLKRAVAAGYDCQRRYVQERAEHEFPGFTVDFGDRAEWKSRSCPSENALNMEEELRPSVEVAGATITIVWLTKPIADEEEDLYDWEPREALAIRGYLGKYDLVKELLQ